MLLPAQGGRARLPDVFIADKNDTAKFQGEQAGKFALMALAVRRGEGGQLVAIEHVTPAVSNSFVVSGAAASQWLLWCARLLPCPVAICPPPFSFGV